MLFYLDNSLIVDAGHQEFKPILKSVHNLATQAVEGNHLLLGDVEVIDHFRNIFENDIIVGQLFRKIASNMAINTVPSSVTFYMEVIRGANSQRAVGGVAIYQMNYIHFSTLDSCGQTMAIGEDLNDVKVFEHILKWFINRTHTNLHYSLHRLGGNGKNINRVVQNELNSKHITICIIDTDMKHPNYAPDPNSTYALCLPIGNGVPYYKFIPLNVHEIENIIPFNYIDTFDVWTTGGTANDVRNKRAFDFLRAQANDILPYFDYKKGIHKTTELTSNADYSNYAEKCFSVNTDKTAAHADYASYLSSIGNNGIVYEQLLGGSGILTRTVSLIESPTCPTPVLETFQENEWLIIGQNMLNWCIARSREDFN